MQLQQRIRGWQVGMMAVLLAAVTVSVGHGDNPNEWRGAWNAVFTLTNDPDGNELAMFPLDNKGQMKPPVFIPTGGDGTGNSLGNQSALVMSKDTDYLYAVNPGSNTISVFRLTRQGPQVIQTVYSGGTRPISIALRGELLYVLNAGGGVDDADSIAGFTVRENGRLRALPGSIRPLAKDDVDTGPAQIAFSPSGDALIVTLKATNKIAAYALNRRGIPVDLAIEPSVGTTPFGFEFSRDGFLIVSEAFGGAAGASAVSSYWFDDDAGTLEPLGKSVPTTQTAACWIAVTENGALAYTTNTGSNTVTGYSVGKKGKLTRVTDNGIAAQTGAAPTDMTVRGSNVLFVLNRNDGSVGSYSIKNGGALAPIQVAGGLDGLLRPTGLVVR